MKALDRAGAIHQSLHVFVYGFAGLLPVIGIVPATAAVIRGFKIRRAYAEPNPANHYRRWGMALGSLGVLVNLCAIAIVVTNIMDALNRGYWPGTE